MEDKGRQQSRGHRHNPKRGQVTEEGKAGISAAPEQADNAHTGDGDKTDDDSQHGQHIPGQQLGFFRDVVEADGRIPDQQDDASSQNPHDHRQPPEPANPLGGSFHVACADGVAYDDSSCVGHTEDDHGGELVDHRGNLAGRNHMGAQPAQNHGLDRDTHRPQHLIAGYRQAVFQVVPEEGHVKAEKVPGPHSQPLVNEENIAAHQQKFGGTGDQGRQRGTFNAHLGRTQVAEDEDPVEEDVDHQTGDGVDHSNPDNGHAAQGAEQGRGKAEQHIGPAHNPQVGGAAGDNLRVRGVNLHDGFGENQHRQHQQQAHHHCHLHHHGDDDFDGLNLSFSPILSVEDTGAAGKAEDQQVKNEEGLVCQGGGGQLGLSHCTQHHRVHHLGGQGNQVLGHHGQRQGNQYLQKGTVCQHTAKGVAFGSRHGEKLLS